MSKVVLVTGSSGHLGKTIVRKAKAKGYRVFGVDIALAEETDMYYDLTSEDHVEAMISHEMLDDVENIDYCIHCAATIYGVAGFNNNGFEILSDDVRMTTNMLDCFGNTTRFVFLSSSMVYENVPKFKGVGFHEDAKEDDVWKYPAPKTGYGLSKFVGEKLVTEWAKTYGKYTIWRPFNIINPMEKAGRIQGYSHVFADFYESLVIRKANPLPIIGNGEQIRCFTWYEEVADCIVDNLENPDTENETFNIANREPVTMKELAMMIHDEAVRRGIRPNDCELEFEKTLDIPLDVKYRVPNVDKARNLLGFEAKVSTAEAVRRMFEDKGNVDIDS